MVAIAFQLKRVLFGSARNVQFIQAEEKDKFTHSLDLITNEMKLQQQRFVSW